MIQHLKFLSLLAGFAALVATFSSCDRDKEDNEEELITTVKLTFSRSGETDKVFTFKDSDGAGGNAPVIDEILLAPNATYTVSVAVLNESVTPAENITEEIETEKDAHLFVYSVSGAKVTFAATDTDSAGKPVGLTATATTAAASTGSLTLTLKHEADKSAAEPLNTGETDVEATFVVKIQ